MKVHDPATMAMHVCATFTRLDVLLVLLTAFGHLGNGQTIAQVNTLATTLLTGYNANTRPLTDQTTEVSVNLTLSLLAIRDFDEVLGKLSTAMVFQVRWYDQSLVWDPNTNNYIDNIVFSQDSVWKPLITVANPYDDLKELGDKNWVTVNVQHDGFVQWDPFAALDTTCDINTRYYPFDTQECKIEMYAFGYTAGGVTLKASAPTLDFSFYEGHATWDIVSTSLGSATKGVSPNIVPILKLNVKLERKPNFVITTFVLPILVLALLNPIVFLLPADSGERIGYSITILLALSVFITILADYIPQNAEPMSMCANMLMILYICSASIVVLVIFSMKVYFVSETRPVYSFLEAYVRFCSCGCLRKSKITVGDYDASMTDDHKARVEGSVVKATELEKDIAQTPIEKISWKDVSNAFDKCSFVITYITIVLVIVIYITILRNG